jgi:hypothetical protein
MHQVFRRGIAMDTLRRISSLLGPLAAVVTLACGVSCASSSQTGSTSAQAPSKCLDKGSMCTLDNECCSEWCANGVCVRKSP